MARAFLIIGSIVLICGLVFVVPMVSMAEKSDNMAEDIVKAAVIETVDTACAKGGLTKDNYEKLYSTIASTGNVYDVEVTVMVLDENPGKKTSQSEYTKIGENQYYKEYTSTVESEIEINGVYKLKEGNNISISAKNTNISLFQSIKNKIYNIAGSNINSIGYQHSGLVTGTWNE